MARTTTATPNPAPRNGRNGKIRTIKADPAAIAAATPAELAAPVLPDSITPAQEPAQERKAIPAKFAAAAAKVAAARAAKPAKRQATPRASVTAQELENLNAMGWPIPKIDADWEATPKKRQRFNSCAGADAYEILAETVAVRPITLADVAELWLAMMGAPEEGKKTAPQAILQQVANRLQRTVKQDGLKITAV